jgi:hypothetical protein
VEVVLLCPQHREYLLLSYDILVLSFLYPACDLLCPVTHNLTQDVYCKVRWRVTHNRTCFVFVSAFVLYSCLFFRCCMAEQADVRETQDVYFKERRLARTIELVVSSKLHMYVYMFMTIFSCGRPRRCSRGTRCLLRSVARVNWSDRYVPTRYLVPYICVYVYGSHPQCLILHTYMQVRDMHRNS